MGDKEVNINIQTAYDWLYKFGDKKSYLGPTVKKIINNLENERNNIEPGY